MEDEVWDSAEIAFNKLIVEKVGNYSLMTALGTDSLDYIYAYLCNYSGIDLDNGTKHYMAENNQESIFECQNTLNNSSTWNMFLNGYGCDGSLYTTYFSILGYWNIGVPKTFISKYEKITPTATVPLHVDPRLHCTAYQPGDTIKCFGFFDEKYCNQDIAAVSRLEKGAFQPAGWSLKKYLFPMFAATTANGQNDPTNIRFITYAGILLNQAEVKYQLNKDAEALDLINEIRNRVGLPDTTTSDVLALLLHEIEIEQATEGTWMVNIMRWARTANKRTSAPQFVNPTTYKSAFKSNKNEYLPIPQYEMDYMTEGEMQQNPGW